MEIIHGELVRQHTSGSIGKYLDIFWYMAGYNRSMMKMMY